MTVAIINQTIREMCLEVKSHASAMQNWRLMTEEELMFKPYIIKLLKRVLLIRQRHILKMK